jgi:hypothetical protein
MLSKYEIREIAKELAKLLTAKQEKPKKLLTATEAAAYLKVKVQTLYNNKDAYPHRKVGKRLMFEQDGLDRSLTGTATASQ